jgi:hypothetical protein
MHQVPKPKRAGSTALFKRTGAQAAIDGDGKHLSRSQKYQGFARLDPTPRINAVTTGPRGCYGCRRSVPILQSIANGDLQLDN